MGYSPEQAEIDQLIPDGFVPTADQRPLEEWHHLIMANCGDNVERYPVVLYEVPFYRLASWAESRLKQAEELEARLAK